MENEADFLALFVTKRDDIDELIPQNILYESQKVQLKLLKEKKQMSQEK